MRRVLAALIVVGLAVAVALLWPGSSTDEPVATIAGPTTTTTTPSTTRPPATTTTTLAATTTSTSDGHVVETTEEAEQILRKFLYMWFKAIAEEDEALLRSVIANPRQVEAGIEQFGSMEFSSQPNRKDIIVNDLQILHSDSECLVTWSDSGAEFRGGSSSAVHVFRWSEGSWLFLNTWLYADDLWEADCEARLQP